MNRTSKRLALLLLALIPAAWVWPGEEDRSTPQAAVEALKKALDANDFAALGQIVPGPCDAVLRKLAGPMGQAQAAQSRLEAALKDQPQLTFTNPFAAALGPFSGLLIELVEVGKEGSQNIVRVRCGRKGAPPQEEVLGLVSEGAAWRIGLPGEFAKELRRLAQAPEELQTQADRLAALAKVLTTLAEEVEKKQFKSREALILRLAQLVADAGLVEETKKEAKRQGAMGVR
jgi:hypothetical protein